MHFFKLFLFFGNFLIDYSKALIQFEGLKVYEHCTLLE